MQYSTAGRLNSHCANSSAKSDKIDLALASKSSIKALTSFP